MRKAPQLWYYEFWSFPFMCLIELGAILPRESLENCIGRSLLLFLVVRNLALSL